jgi:hypothetical protein
MFVPTPATRTPFIGRTLRSIPAASSGEKTPSRQVAHVAIIRMMSCRRPCFSAASDSAWITSTSEFRLQSHSATT